MGATDATLEAAAREAIAAVAGTMPGEGSATEALRRFIGAVLEISERYADMIRELRFGERQRDPVVVATLKAVLKRGRETGEFTGEGTIDWWVEVLAGTVLAALGEVEAGMGREEAADLAMRSLLRGMAA